jgi:hypothetical protein
VHKILSLQPPADAGCPLAAFPTLKMEAIHSSETSVNSRSTQHHIPEDDILLVDQLICVLLCYLKILEVWDWKICVQIKCETCFNSVWRIWDSHMPKIYCGSTYLYIYWEENRGCWCKIRIWKSWSMSIFLCVYSCQVTVHNILMKKAHFHVTSGNHPLSMAPNSSSSLLLNTHKLHVQETVYLLHISHVNRQLLY